MWIMEIVGRASALDDGGNEASYFDIGDGVFGDVVHASGASDS